MKQWGEGRNGNREAAGVGGSGSDGVCQILSTLAIVSLPPFSHQACASKIAPADPRKLHYSAQGYGGERDLNPLSFRKPPTPPPQWIQPMPFLSTAAPVWVAGEWGKHSSELWVCSNKLGD